MTINWNMLPLLLVALLIWGGVMAYLYSVERKVAKMEQKLDELLARPKDVQV